MSIIQSIRQTRLLVGVIGIALFFFIAQELVKTPFSLFRKGPVVGILSGKKIKLKEFEIQIAQLEQGYLATYRQAPSEAEMIYLRQHAWERLINDKIYPELCQSIGIQVTEDELVDMVQGDHIHPDIQAAFISPKTQQFSKDDLLNALSNLAKLPLETQQQWHMYEKNLAKQRCQEKYQQLIEHSVYVTTLEAQQTWMLENTVLNLEYIHIPYTQLPGSEAQIKPTAMESYIRKDKATYSVEENKEIQYITFPIHPSESDSVAFHQELAELQQAFMQTAEDKAFASTHTDASEDKVTIQCTQATLPAELLPYKDQLKKGAVIGPIADKHPVYKLYKVTSISSGKEIQYELQVLEKTLSYSDDTKELCFQETEACSKEIKTPKQFEAYAQKHAKAIAHAKVYREDTRIDYLQHVRPLVRWLYNKGKVDKISPVFQIGDQYVIAVIVRQTPAGIIPLEQVREAVHERMKHEDKVAMFKEELKSLNLTAASPHDVATHYGDKATHHTAERIRFDSTYLPTVGKVKQVINSAFALEPGQRSTAIGESSGVILVTVTNRSTQPLPESWKNQQTYQRMLEQYKQVSTLFEALTKSLRIADYRYKYY